MAEYIEREALLKRLNFSPLFSNILDGGYFIKSGVLDLVERQPKADVVGVRHGYWISGWDTVCSVCKIDVDVYGVERFNYCPNCGAKMDGKEEAAAACQQGLQ